MEKTLSSQAKDWREGRRLRAFELKEEGWKQTEIADALGVSEGAVNQWMKRTSEKGVQAFRHKPPPGAPPRLSEDEPNPRQAAHCLGRLSYRSLSGSEGVWVEISK
jgi:transposase